MPGKVPSGAGKKDGKTCSEEFAEEIPYEETNNYVKKVLENYWLYRSLYQQPNKNKEPQKSTDPVLVWKDISNK